VREKLKSRKLWITVAAMSVPLALLAGCTWVMVAAPEKAGSLTAVAAAISAVLTTAAGAVYVVTEGRIDLRALPRIVDPMLQAVLELAARSSAFYEELMRLAEKHAAEPPPEDSTD